MAALTLLVGLATSSAATAASRIASSHRSAIWTTIGTGKSCGDPPHCGDGFLGSAATLAVPDGIAFDRAGTLYIADRTDDEVRAVSGGIDQTITRMAGNGLPCSNPPACGDGGPASQASLSSPSGVAVDPRGGLFVVDTQDDEVRLITRAGTISRVAGDGSPCASAPNCGDGGPATQAQLNLPQAAAMDSMGNLYIADGGDNEIRKVAPNGIITRVAGDGQLCLAPPACGDGRHAIDAQLAFPGGVSVDSSGNLYIADAGDNELRKVLANGSIRRVAGNGLPCTRAPKCGDGGPAARATLNFPDAVTWSPRGGLYIADRFDQEIRRISGGKITRVAGSGRTCRRGPSCGNGGSPLKAALNSPQGVALDRAGNLWIADSGNNNVRMVAPAIDIWRNGRDTALHEYRKVGCKWPMYGRAVCNQLAAQVLTFQTKLGRVRCFGPRRQLGQTACQIARPMVAVASNTAMSMRSYLDRHCPGNPKRGPCATLRKTYDDLEAFIKTTLRSYS